MDGEVNPGKCQVIRDFFEPNILLQVRQDLQPLTKNVQGEEQEVFQRRVFSHTPLLDRLHTYHVHSIAERIFERKLVATKNFYSIYHAGQGICPPHYDHLDCAFTVDVCLESARPWAIYFNESDRFVNQISRPQASSGYGETMDAQLIEDMKSEAVAYWLSPGDALFFHGHRHPHWRERLPLGQSCEMAFFHFKSS